MKEQRESERRAFPTRVALAVGGLVLFAFAVYFDAFHAIAAWSVEHPSFHIDKLLVLGVLVLALYAFHANRPAGRPAAEPFVPTAAVPRSEGPGTEVNFAALLNEAPDPIVLLDLAGNITFFSQAAERMTGYEAQQVIGNHFTKIGLLSQASLPRATQSFAQILTSAAVAPFDLEVVTRAGSTSFVEANPALIRRGTGLVGVQVSFRDISQRRQTEAALRHSQASLLLAQQIGQVGSWELDLATRQLSWSEETYRLFGIDPASATPSEERFHESVFLTDREEVRKAMEAATQDGKDYSLDHRIVRPDGTIRVVHEQAQVMRDEQARPTRLVGTVHDVTERKQLEDHLRQSQKLEAVGRLAGGMAHDFNNILTIIQGYTEVILATPNLNPVTAARLKQVAAAADRAVSLTRQLLAFSRKQVMRPEPLDLNTAIRNGAQMLERVLGSKISLHLDLHANLPLLHADPDMIEEILLNLSDNARDAMPNGGRITIQSSLKEFGSGDLRSHPEARPGRFLCFSFNDTGIGMDAATAAQVFEPFFTTKGQGGGKGMGLATVYGIVKQHQGWVELQTALGAGTTFRFYLPLAPEHLKLGVAEGAKPPASGGAETVLLVEDEAPLRALATVILQRNGYTVLEAGSGPEALEVWKKHGHQIQMLLTDMVMPGGMTGRDLALQLSRQRSSLRVLYTSGYSRDIVQADFALREGIRFLPKPYNSNTLTQAVRECLDATAPLAPG